MILFTTIIPPLCSEYYNKYLKRIATPMLKKELHIKKAAR